MESMLEKIVKKKFDLDSEYEKDIVVGSAKGRFGA